MSPEVTPTWLWTALALGLIVLEGTLAGTFVAVFFAAGALTVAAAVASGALAEVWQQCVAFAVTSIGALLAARRPLRASAKRMAQRTPLEPDRGARVRVLRAMAPNTSGEVSLHGTLWAARNVGHAPLEVDDEAFVHEVEGLSLLVARSKR